MRERGEAGLDGWIRWVRETGFRFRFRFRFRYLNSGGGERRGQGWMDGVVR